MIDATVEACSIVHRFIPRHLLAVDRNGLTTAIEAAILDAQLQAATAQTCDVPVCIRARCGFVGFSGRCEQPANHEGSHLLDGNLDA